jgi:serine/threonine protein kinase
MLSDETLAHLRDVVERPDLTGTRYELIEEAGRGGMGIVYLARDCQLERRVALKILDHLGIEEARTLASLEHPGIVPVHDSGVLPDGRAFYAMKFVDGMRLDRYRDSGPPLTALLRVFERICEPVAFAHARGVIHRDIKPQNVMVGAFGEVLVLDWGVPGLGTRDYLPPEGAQDARSDVYALGRTLEFLLANQAKVPRPLRSICAKAGDPTAALRYDDAGAMARDVAAYLDGLVVAAHREYPWEIAARFLRRHRLVAALVITYLVMRALLFFLIRR